MSVGPLRNRVGLYNLFQSLEAVIPLIRVNYVLSLRTVYRCGAFLLELCVVFLFFINHLAFFCDDEKRSSNRAKPNSKIIDAIQVNCKSLIK